METLRPTSRGVFLCAYYLHCRHGIGERIAAWNEIGIGAGLGLRVWLGLRFRVGKLWVETLRV